LVGEVGVRGGKDAGRHAKGDESEKEKRPDGEQDSLRTNSLADEDATDLSDPGEDGEAGSDTGLK
jgi:hypothetical protein